jgi:hypothetical protein
MEAIGVNRSAHFIGNDDDFPGLIAGNSRTDNQQPRSLDEDKVQRLVERRKTKRSEMPSPLTMRGEDIV